MTAGDNHNRHCSQSLSSVRQTTIIQNAAVQAFSVAAHRQSELADIFGMFGTPQMADFDSGQ